VARFRFELEALLTARRNTERERQRAVAVLEQERLTIEARIRAHQGGIVSGKSTVREQLVGSVDVGTLRAHAGRALHHVRAAQQEVVTLAGVQRRLLKARADLVEAARARRAIERLRERRFAAWKARLDKLEAGRLDELAMQIEARKRREDED
jgi:flagellar export protein FliJ